MKKVVFDSLAILTLFSKQPGYELVRDLLVRMANEETEGYISVISVTEIFSMIERKSSRKTANEAIKTLTQMPIIVIDIDLKQSIDAGAFRSEYSLNYTDAFTMVLANQKKATLVSANDVLLNAANKAGIKVKVLQ